MTCKDCIYYTLINNKKHNKYYHRCAKWLDFLNNDQGRCDKFRSRKQAEREAENEINP